MAVMMNAYEEDMICDGWESCVMVLFAKNLPTFENVLLHLNLNH